MYNNGKRGYNVFPISGIYEHDVSGVEAVKENNNLVIHLPISLLTPIIINGNQVPISKYKDEKKTRKDLGFKDPNINLSHKHYKKLEDIWVPCNHSFIVGNRVYTMGKTTQKDQETYSKLIQDITGIHYDGNLHDFANDLNMFFTYNRLCLTWTVFVPKDESLSGRWFIAPSGENMFIRQKSCKAA